jgi:hypothetical protein
MSAAATVRTAVAAGISIKLDGDLLVLSATRRPDDRLIQDLRRDKTEIVAYLRGFACWSEEDWQALFDERAGIMEFDAGMPRAEAEARAAEEVANIRAVLEKADG